CETNPPATNYVLVYRGTIGTSNSKALDPVDDSIAIATAHFLPPADPPPRALAVYENTFRVPDYANPPFLANRLPYPRPHNIVLPAICNYDPNCGALGSLLPECDLPDPVPPHNSYALKSPLETVDLSSR